MFHYEVEVGVDSGQMSVVPFSEWLKTDKLNCYAESSLIKIIDANPGDEVYVSVEYSDEGSWGIRIKEISAKVGVYPTGSPIGSFTVPDTGKIVVSDPCYIMDGDYYGDRKEGDLGIPGYDAACQATTGGEQAGMFSTGGGMGACSCTGYGDGVYPLRVGLGSDGKFAELTVDFFPEEWEDDDVENEGCDGWETISGS